MKARIVRIRNYRGIRIPKPLLAEAGPGEDVEMVVEGNTLVISPVRRPRTGWDEAFRSMAAEGDNRMLGRVQPTRWETDAWQW